MRKKVMVVEPLESETNMHVDLQGTKFIAKCEGRRMVTVGDRIGLVTSLDHLHIFDAQSTPSIY